MTHERNWFNSESHVSPHSPNNSDLRSASSTGNVLSKAADFLSMTTLSSRLFHTASAHSVQDYAAPLRTNHHSYLSPKDRFRAAVHKIIAMHRGASSIIAAGGLRVGAEPGVDPRRRSAHAMHSHIEGDCSIEVVDYSSVRSKHRTMTKSEFIEFMDMDGGEQPSSSIVDGKPDITREPWVKVRWINIGGISWSIIKALALRYDLHPLALEEILHGHSRNRSKAEYYAQHLMLHVLCHEVGNSPESSSGLPGQDMGNESFRASHKDHNTAPSKRLATDTLYRFSGRKYRNVLPRTRNDTHTPMNSELEKILTKENNIRRAKKKHLEQELSVEAMKAADERVHVRVSPMFMFLLRDGTVISIHAVPNSRFTAPITQRLRSRDTLLRKSADPSMLIHSLLDLIVDRSLEVAEEYHRQITKYEHDILLHVSSKRLRQLHVLSGDLILHQRTLDPIKTLIYGLRRYDLDRCAALVDASDAANKDVKVVGFMSHTSKIYLADVYDHMVYILTSLDMYSNVTENLINYSFNAASYEMSNIMRLLTLVTILFLPLTFLTGYFGMNFEFMWSVKKNSDLLFWEIAIPILLVTIPIAMLVDIRRLWHYMQKKHVSRAALRRG
ncbi:hypothetical protein CVT24_000237 [Panaeolus cyanescens]|uniref:Magnesium transport protein CorA n=1 Tax=Panaeolus cyanescens TaxID=181874 RepID=A0A409VII8_9AGAR|nr:hypothetical protein CVT24_000237 [Panaeolus cyanescens]